MASNEVLNQQLNRMNLVIVESPAKAKTIEGFLGKDFVVKSSYGHVRDLPSKGLSIDVENGFVPNYEVLKDKKAVIKELKSLAKKAETVWLATDEDREGEAISWHLFEVLGLTDDQTKRIVFNEITKPAVVRAIENPRLLDKNLVDAQQARRILDRIVGFEISPVLWKKVKPSLSAGRVQSVAVRLIDEREQEIIKFEASSFFRVNGEFLVGGSASLKSRLKKDLTSEEEAEGLLKNLENAQFSVGAINKKPGTRNPAPPFTTSTLQQEAGRKLGYSVAQTMSVAQRLYESGKITYMRTDSVNLSETARKDANAEIVRAYGEEYAKTRNFSTKSKGAQEAHEAIRPTSFATHSVDGERQEQALYDLIWKRSIASQMSEAKIERTEVEIENDKEKERIFIAKAEMIQFDGFLKVYMEGSDDEKEDDLSVIPPINSGDKLDLKEIRAEQKRTNHPPRYTESSLVKKLEQLGIGRPSTYAPTISTIQKRGYVVKEDREPKQRDAVHLFLKPEGYSKELIKENYDAEKKKLFPTDIGSVVNDFLKKEFEQIMDFNFTAQVENQFDEIADGKTNWNKMIADFYKPFHDNVQHTLEHSERATGERLLGTDPKSGKNVYARIGRFGPMIQIGEVEDEAKPKFAGIKGNSSIQLISLEEALKMFDLPKELGEFEEEVVNVGEGRYGPYVRHKNKFFSIKEQNPMTLKLEEAIEIIEKAREEAKNNMIKEFPDNEDVKVINGRYGPYIKVGKKNVKIPKDKDPESLTLEECLELAENVKKSAPRRKKKS